MLIKQRTALKVFTLNVSINASHLLWKCRKFLGTQPGNLASCICSDCFYLHLIEQYNFIDSKKGVKTGVTVLYQIDLCV